MFAQRLGHWCLDGASRRTTRGAKSREVDRPRDRAPMLTLLSMVCNPLLWILCVDLNRQ